ncbi:hypothetical protein [Nonomuraea gerenzanensis]|uniref:SsDNA binding protein n=1 Tax=Nonomuraea gerenzanensis TaxID=93944 RepID=A0A1M4BKW8_9ACTN|nr:hypothetical protein [Nonomuraea gerenzanensis]UBU09996.1 hypothetical protein LCN96_37345 [Nonomuraea gerenzanensis]SAP16295.1 hypothetical protein BN4615_P10958 [Nonomuraea gerenzanensis]
MTNNSPATINLPAPARVGQATAVEQSRAVAEVHAAMVMARQYPRRVDAAVAEMERCCQQPSLAKRAFFRFSRGGETVTGPSIHLARELARCWGNVQHGLAEMSRDDQHGQSEMQAFAWDVETNSRVSSTFIVPHKRDTRSGVKALVDMRDIYENNTNNGARRVRESIFAVLPSWFVERAKDLCNATIEKGDGAPLEKRVDEAVAAFASGGITQDQIERKLGRPVARWTAQDVAQLEVIFTSLRRGEVTKDEEFPPDRVTSSDIPAGDAKPAPVQPPAPAETEPPSTPAAGAATEAAPESPEKREAGEQQVRDLFDHLDTKIPNKTRLDDLTVLFSRRVTALADLGDSELADLAQLLADCGGKTAAWQAAVDAQRQQAGGQA